MTTENEGLVTVLITGSGSTIAVARPVLEGAEIPYFEKGGASRDPGLQVFNLSAWFVEFQARPEAASAARELVARLEQEALTESAPHAS